MLDCIKRDRFAIHKKRTWQNGLSIQKIPDKEDSEVDLDDDGHVVQGEGVGEVGDDDQDGGREEGGQYAAHQWSRQLKKTPRAQDGPENNLTWQFNISHDLKNCLAHINPDNCVLDQLP